MHPLIRVLCLVALASGLPLLALTDLLVISAVLLLVQRWLAVASLGRLRTGLWRLRWLLLAILILYWGFTPGEPVLAVLPGLSVEGVFEGLRRVWVIVCLLMAVYLLLALTPVPELARVLRTLVTPLRFIGLHPDRFALRLALALDGVGAAQARLDSARAASRGFTEAAVATVRALEDAADTAVPALPLPALPPVPVWQWLMPVALLLLLHGVLT